MYPETPLYLCPIGPDQGGPRIAICIWQGPLPPAPQGRSKVPLGVRDQPGDPPFPVSHRAGVERRTTECYMFPETALTRSPAGPDRGGPRCARCIRKPPLPGAPQGRSKAEHGVRDATGNHSYPVYRRAGSGRTEDCELHPETTLTRYPVMPDRCGPRSARCIRKPPLPGAPQGRIKAEHGVREATGNHSIPGAPQGRIKADHGVRHGSGHHPYPVPRRAESWRAAEFDVYPETTFTRCPVGPAKGGALCATYFPKPPLPGAR